jgi:ATP-binding cassette, subfamily A (ABC1), member 3
VVNGRLRCLGSSQHLKLRYGNGFEVNIKTMTADDQTIDAFINSLSSQQEKAAFIVPGQNRLSKSQILSLCSSLGKPERVSVIEDEDQGKLIKDVLQVDGFVNVKTFANWWLTEDQADKLKAFFQNLQSFHLESILLERSSAHSFRYRVVNPATSSQPMTLSLGQLFQHFEAAKLNLQIQEYSIGQTTLEQIFNELAASEDNPEIAVRQSSDTHERPSAPIFPGLHADVNVLDEVGSSHLPLVITTSSSSSAANAII